MVYPFIVNTLSYTYPPTILSQAIVPHKFNLSLTNG